MMSRACTGSTYRGLEGWKLNPSASAPAATAARASATRVIPQIFALTRIAGAWEKRGSLPDVSSSPKDKGCAPTRKYELRTVGHVDEVQPVGRCRWTREGTIAFCQDLADPRGRTFAASDLQQRAGDVADHVMQKGVCRDVEHDQIVEAAHLYRKNTAIGRLGLTCRCAKRRKIVLAEERPRGGVHCSIIKTRERPGHEVPANRRKALGLDEHI